MKKRILNLVLAICLIMPCMFALSACNKKEKSYTELVNKINTDQEFALEHYDELIQNTINKNFKLSSTYDCETEQITFCKKYDYVYGIYEYEGIISKKLCVYESNFVLNAEIDEEDEDEPNIRVYLIERANVVSGFKDYESNVKSLIDQRLFYDEIESIVAEEISNGYTLTLKSKYEYDDEVIECKYTIKDGLIVEFIDDEITYSLEYISSPIMMTFNSLPFNSIETMLIGVDQYNVIYDEEFEIDTSELVKHLDNINKIYLDHRSFFNMEVLQNYLDENFEEIGYDYDYEATLYQRISE